jgi:hypothetical protein
MDADSFRELALGLPEVVEQSHMGPPDFRVGGRIFATLGPDGEWGMAKLRPDQQSLFVTAHPGVFEPASGAWGRGGSTIIRLAAAKQHSVKEALILAWRNTAPKKLVRAFVGNS